MKISKDWTPEERLHLITIVIRDLRSLDGRKGTGRPLHPNELRDHPLIWHAYYLAQASAQFLEHNRSNFQKYIDIAEASEDNHEEENP